MRGGGRRDDDAVDAGGQQRLDRITGLAPCLAATAATTSGRSSVMTRPSTLSRPGQRVGVEGADAAQADYAEGGHGILRSSWCAQCDVEFVRAEVVGERGQHRVDLTGRGQAADRLVAVEVGGERVALRGGDHGVDQFVAAGLAGRFHRPQRRDTPRAPSPCGPAPPSPGRTATRSAAGWRCGGFASSRRNVRSRTVIQRRVEEHRVALGQRESVRGARRRTRRTPAG